MRLDLENLPLGAKWKSISFSVVDNTVDVVGFSHFYYDNEIEVREEMNTSGSWSVRSEIDSRWNGSGTSDSVGGFAIPIEAQIHIDKMKLTLGQPPEDLEWSYMKD